jgi:nucleoside-diphosphate-sugar epimerase
VIRGTRVLVTGAGGFVGHHLVRRLAAEGARVRAFVHYNSASHWGLLEGAVPRGVEIFPGDVTDPARTAEAVAGCPVVFHLAALIAIPYSYRARASYLETNVRGTQNVLEAALRARTRRLVVTSTSEVYGSARTRPMSEEHPISPQSPYAASKAAADLLALAYHRSFGLPVTLLRPFNVYGPGQSARAVIPAILAQALAGGPLRLGDVSTVRDFTFVEDTVDAFVRAAERGPAGEVLNVGTGTGLRIGEVVRRTARLLGRPLKVRTERARLRPRASEVTALVCDASRARRALGWRPRVSFDDGLARTLQWVRQNLDRFKTGHYSI